MRYTSSQPGPTPKRPASGRCGYAKGLKCFKRSNFPAFAACSSPFWCHQSGRVGTSTGGWTLEMWCYCGDEEDGVEKTCLLFPWKLDEAKDRIKVATYSKMPGVIPGCWLPLLPGQFGAGTGHCGLQ